MESYFWAIPSHTHITNGICLLCITGSHPGDIHMTPFRYFAVPSTKKQRPVPWFASRKSRPAYSPLADWPSGSDRLWPTLSERTPAAAEFRMIAWLRKTHHTAEHTLYINIILNHVITLPTVPDIYRNGALAILTLFLGAWTSMCYLPAILVFIRVLHQAFDKLGNDLQSADHSRTW